MNKGHLWNDDWYEKTEILEKEKSTLSVSNTILNVSAFNSGLRCEKPV
jgi:hypothetical protein